MSIRKRWHLYATQLSVVQFPSRLPEATLLAAWALAFCLVVARPVEALDDLRTVVLTGQQAPGTAPGVVFEDIGSVRFNEQGQVAFGARLAGPGVIARNNETAIFSEGSGTLSLVARLGDQVPGADPGVEFLRFDVAPPRIPTSTFSASGRSVFPANLSGLYSDRSGTLDEIVRTGEQAPGANLGTQFTGFINSPAINASGQIAFNGRLSSGGLFNEGIYSEGQGELAEVARSRQQVPGADPGVLFGSFSPPVINDAGETAFSATHTIASSSGTVGRGIYSDRDGVLSAVASSGSLAPDRRPDTTFTFFGPPRFNELGQTAFQGFVTAPGTGSSNDERIFSEASGALSVVAREGDQAPGAAPRVLFDTFDAFSVQINASGQTAFEGSLRGPGVVEDVNDAAIYIETDGILAEFVRAGDQAPGADPGVVFANELSFGRFVLNDLGQIAMSAPLAGPGVDDSNDIAIYATDTDGSLIEIIRAGDVIDVDGDPLTAPLTTTGIGFSGFNNLGQIAFTASFTDGTEGVFVTNQVAIPEPSTLAITLASLAVCLRSQGRRRHYAMQQRRWVEDHIVQTPYSENRLQDHLKTNSNHEI